LHCDQVNSSKQTSLPAASCNLVRYFPLPLSTDSQRHRAGHYWIRPQQEAIRSDTGVKSSPSKPSSCYDSAKLARPARLQVTMAIHLVAAKHSYDQQPLARKLI